MFPCAGDLSTEDPVHGGVHGGHAEPVSQQETVVLHLHAVRGGQPRAVEACRERQSPGSYSITSTTNLCLHSKLLIHTLMLLY